MFLKQDLAEKHGLTIPKQPKTGKHALVILMMNFLLLFIIGLKLNLVLLEDGISS